MISVGCFSQADREGCESCLPLGGFSSTKSSGGRAVDAVMLGSNL